MDGEPALEALLGEDLRQLDPGLTDVVVGRSLRHHHHHRHQISKHEREDDGEQSAGTDLVPIPHFDQESVVLLQLRHKPATNPRSASGSTRCAQEGIGHRHVHAVSLHPHGAARLEDRLGGVQLALAQRHLQIHQSAHTRIIFFRCRVDFVFIFKKK